MTGEISRRVSGSVRESSDSTSKVTEADVHGNSNTTFGGSANVVTVPGNTHRYVGVNSSSGEEGSQVLNTRLVTGDQHDKSNDTETAEKDHEDPTLTLPIGKITTTNCADTGKDVRRDSHELRLLVGVAHNLDNGREEKGEGVKRGVDSDGDQHVYVNLPILDSVEEVLDVVLVSQGSPVSLESAVNLGPLFWVQELGTKDGVNDEFMRHRGDKSECLRFRVVVNGPISNECNDNSYQTLEDEDPSPTSLPTNTIHLRDTSREQPSKSSSKGSGREKDGHA